MNRNALHVCLLVCAFGCSTPQQQPAPAPPSADATAKELARLKESVAKLENKVGHLESEISAASADGELTTLSIDAVEWGDGKWMTSSDPTPNYPILCHVVEWKGFGKMLRFTRKADPYFDLVAEGHPTLNAIMMEGGQSTSNGSMRAVVLLVKNAPAPNAMYHLRPRNENDRYRWSVPDSLVIVAPDPKR